MELLGRAIIDAMNKHLDHWTDRPHHVTDVVLTTFTIHFDEQTPLFECERA